MIPRSPMAIRSDAGASELIGSYRIEELIASGGMGAVYRAAHAFLPRRAAVKVLHAEMLDTHSATDRMLQEARILDSLDHPTIVKIYDAGLLADGRPWVAMELLEGQTLANHLLVHHRLRAREAAQIVVAVTEALMRSHEVGVVHRDVKPENIMLVAGERGLEVKLIDWGIAHLTSMTQRLTLQDYSPGTPCYMSPEQLRCRQVDGRTDLYALGVVAYEMLSGAPPFDGNTSLEIAVQALHDAVPPLPAELCVAPRIERLIRTMLAKHPANRPSFEDVRDGFAEWAQQLADAEADDYCSLEIELPRKRLAATGALESPPAQA